MKISGCYTLNGPREQVWPLIYDPVSLVSLIPGCEQIEQVSPDEYRGQMQVRLPAVSGVFHTYVKIIERDAPHCSRFEGEVHGSAGSIKGAAFFELKEVEPQQTLIIYEGQAIISGALAKLNSRFVEGIAKTLIDQGLAKLNKQVQAQATSKPSTGQGPAQDSLIRRVIRRVLAWLG